MPRRVVGDGPDSPESCCPNDIARQSDRKLKRCILDDFVRISATAAAGCRRSLHTETSKPAKSIWVLTRMEPEIGPGSGPFFCRVCSVPSAPIGAPMFAIERRNHSRTGVYGDPCMPVPVDTINPVDKLKKTKKGFKFDDFDVFFQIDGWPRGLQISVARSARFAKLGQIGQIGQIGGREDKRDRRRDRRRGRIRRGTARMGGLPCDLRRPNRRPHLKQKIQERPSKGAIRKHCGNAESPGISSLLSRSPTELQFRSPPRDSRAALWRNDRSHTQRPATRRFPRLFSCERWTGSPTSSISSAAQPLQYGLGKGWDDCSTPQKNAGRGNEETAQ